MSDWETGTAKWFSGQRGTGFIQGHYREYPFVHHSAVESVARCATLIEGDRVEFTAGQGRFEVVGRDVRKT